MDEPIDIWVKPDHCKICRSKTKKLSNQGYCTECSVKKVSTVAAQIKYGKGYYHRKRIAGYKRMLKEEAKK